MIAGNSILRKAFLILSCFTIAAFSMSSTNGYRFLQAKFYEKNGEELKATLICEKILRKSTIKTKKPLISKGKLLSDEIYSLTKRLADDFLRFGYKDKAICYYEILREIDPERIGDYICLYVIKQDIKKTVDIILASTDKELKDNLLPECSKTPFWKYNYGIGLIERERWQEAKDIFSELVVGYPYLSNFHYCLDYVLANLNESAEPEKKFEPSFDIVGIWNFDEGKGSMVNDLSGKFNNGLIMGCPVWAEGISGRALEFDGRNNIVTIPDNPNMFLDGKDFTITLWFKPDRQGKCRFVYSKVGWIFLCFYQIKDPDDTLLFMVGDKIDNEMHKYISIPYVIDGDHWYFIVQRVIQNKQHKVWLFDKDGLITALSMPDISTTTYTDGSDFILGANPHWFRGRKNSARYKGLIDEVKIFNRALKDNEIQALYKYNLGK